jgi:hypothetical protein
MQIGVHARTTERAMQIGRATKQRIARAAHQQGRREFRQIAIDEGKPRIFRISAADIRADFAQLVIGRQNEVAVKTRQ